MIRGNGGTTVGGSDCDLDERVAEAARERAPSPLRAGECLSRQELAELVNARLWHHNAQRVELDGHYVAKLERGVIRSACPTRDWRAPCSTRTG